MKMKKLLPRAVWRRLGLSPAQTNSQNLNIQWKISLYQKKRDKPPRIYGPNESKQCVRPDISFGPVLSSPHVGSGNAPPSRVSSEGGDRGVVGREMRDHPSDSHFEWGKGVVVAVEWAGGVLYEKRLK
jgi:hypothetical protein